MIHLGAAEAPTAMVQLSIRTLAGTSIPAQAEGPAETVASLRARVAPHFGPGCGCRLFLNVSVLPHI